MPENKKPKSDEDFVVVTEDKETNTTILTSTELTEHWLESAMEKYGNRTIYSALLGESAFGNTSVTEEELETLSKNPQSDIKKVIRINNLARYFINRDDLVGKVYETIESNVNTSFKLSYKEFPDNRNKQKKAERAMEIIDDFNDQINVKELIRKAVPITYSEGNYPMYLRSDGNSYTVDYYPLGVVVVSDYEYNGEPYLLFDIRELTSRLRKVNLKNKDGSFLFFDSEEDEVKENYPPEVYDAYMSKNQYAKLDIMNSGILRLNNMNRKYGVTPIFRTFRPSLMLDVFEQSDKVNSQSKGKKIIHQKLRKEVLGKEFDRKAFEEMAYCHDSFLQAWRNKVVIYTDPGWVESISYIEPTVDNTSIENINYYRNKIMTDLGIGFLNSENKGAYASAQISIKELMKMINKITSQLEVILKKWYYKVLNENGIESMYCPKIEIIDSEMLEMEMKLSLIGTIFDKLGASYKTAYDMLGIDYENEIRLRKEENEKNINDIFSPRMNAHTYSAKGEEDWLLEPKAGRKVDNNNPDKQIEDQDRRKSQDV